MGQSLSAFVQCFRILEKFVNVYTHEHSQTCFVLQHHHYCRTLKWKKVIWRKKLV